MEPRLADEVVLRIFSYLDAAHLVRLQLVNTRLCALAKDRQLWKRLFYHNFVRPVNDTPGGDASPRPLPTLRELRSLLLHQNVLTAKHVAGDGVGHIHRLPSRYYNALPQPNSTLASQQEAGDALSSLFQDGLNPNDTSADNLIDWEKIFRVSTNWQRGKFAVSELQSRQQPSSSSSPGHNIVRVSNHFILTASSAEFELYPSAPTISVYQSESLSASVDPLRQSQTPTDLHHRRPILQFSSYGLQRLLATNSSHPTSSLVHVTEIAVDADAVANVITGDTSLHKKRKLDGLEHSSPAPINRVLVAYSTGHISLFSLRTCGHFLKCTEDVFRRPETMASGDYVTMAAMHSPALVLCSSSFDLSFYRVGTSPIVRLDLAHRLASYRCSWPASLRLKKLPYYDVAKRARRSSSSSRADRLTLHDRPEEQAFRVTLAYSTPSYPSSWSVSVQEVVVRLNLDPALTSAVQVTSRHATAKHPFRPSPIDPRGRSMLGRHHSSSPSTSQYASQQTSASEPVMEPTNSRSTSLTYDDPFVVLGASDNLVEVYQLLGATTFVRRDLGDSHAPAAVSRSATATPSSLGGALRLVHRRSLHGHTGSVHSVALEDGRCVSGGADGSVMVWSLGDLANETDSIASVMRTIRATARGARSTSSTILEEEEGDEAARHMAHVLTLRSPFEAEHAESLDAVGKTASYGRVAYARPLGPSLGQIVRSRVLDRQARGVIRWVSTAFDKIVSIVVYAGIDGHFGSIAAGHPPVDAPPQPHERVQVWSFG